MGYACVGGEDGEVTAERQTERERAGCGGMGGCLQRAVGVKWWVSRDRAVLPDAWGQGHGAGWC